MNYFLTEEVFSSKVIRKKIEDTCFQRYGAKTNLMLKEYRDKKAKLERKKQVLNETNRVLANQQRTIESAKNNVVNAMNIGCESKEEYSTVVTQMTQHQTTKSEMQKMRIEQNLSSFQTSKVEQKNNSPSIDKPKVMKKTNSNQGSNTSSSGFANTITLALIVSFVCGALFMIVYMLINK